MSECSAEIPVEGDDSLHLRPMQLLVEYANKFQSNTQAERGDKTADAKSILDVMMLAAEKGPLRLHAAGADADEAIRALEDLMRAELRKE